MNEEEISPEELEAIIAAQLAGHPLLEHAAETSTVPPTDWRHLAGDDARAAWAALREWVEWFTVRYHVPVSVVPTCWWRHGALVEELSALHTLHLASFDKNDTGYGPIGWHERLALAQGRLKLAGAGCASGHFELKPRSWDAATDEAA